MLYFWFYLEIKENHKCLSNDADFRNLLHGINKELNTQVIQL